MLLNSLREFLSCKNRNVNIGYAINMIEKTEGKIVCIGSNGIGVDRGG